MNSVNANIQSDKIIIVIPVYKSSLSKEETVSLKQCLKVLGKYEICLISHENLNFHDFEMHFKVNHVPFQVKYFDEKCFDSVKSYNGLMLSVDFYRSFRAYQYMLIYQLDAFVFEDQLEYWCNKGYDYIGAPWIKSNKKFHPTCGNGGFSLRKIDSFIQLLESSPNKRLFSLKGLFCYHRYRGPLHKLKYVIFWLLGCKNSLKYFTQEEPMNEDLFFSALKYDWFHIPDAQEAMFFSFETYPSFLYQKTGGILPFGCHAWGKYEYQEFWSQYIELN